MTKKAKSDAVPQLDIDVTLGPEAVGDYWNVMTKVRELGPVVWNDVQWSLKDRGQWMINGYRAVMDTLTDWRAFSSQDGVVAFQYDLELYRGLPVECDPPLQRDIRKALNPFFTPTALAERFEEIDAVVEDLLAGCLAHSDSPVDFVSTYTAQLPPRVFLPMVGQGPEQTGELVALIDTMLSKPDESAEANAKLMTWCADLLAARRAEGRADDIPGVIEHLDLTDRQRSETLLLVMMAGIETTMGGLGAAAWQLAINPGMREELRAADDRTLNNAVDEFVRFASPVPTGGRTVTKDTSIAGCPVKSGDRLLVNWASANLDPAHFPNPTEIDFHRDNIATHVGFGAGIHRCLGAHLARREIKATIQAICKLNVFELEPNHNVEWRSSLARGPQALPIIMAR